MRAVGAIGFLIASVLGIMVGVHALQWLVFGEAMLPAASSMAPAEFARMETATPIGRYRELITSWYAPALLAHAVGGALALFSLPVYALARVLKSDENLQNGALLAYVASVMVAAVAGLVMAPTAWGGVMAKIGFSLMAIAWAYSTFRTLNALLDEDMRAHQDWLMRSVALTFAGVTLRLWLPLFLSASVPFEAAYAFVAWWAWVPNLVLVEVWVRGTPHDSRAYVPAK